MLLKWIYWSKWRWKTGFKKLPTYVGSLKRIRMMTIKIAHANEKIARIAFFLSSFLLVSFAERDLMALRQSWARIAKSTAASVKTLARTAPAKMKSNCGMMPLPVKGEYVITHLCQMICTNSPHSICPANTRAGGIIEHSGIYQLDATCPKEIRICAGTSVHIFDATQSKTQFSRTIFLEKGADLVICWYIYDSHYDLEIRSDGERVKTSIAYLLASKNHIPVSGKIAWKTRHSDSCANVSLVSFAWENGDVTIDGIMDIWPDCKNINAYLQEDAIFLGDHGKIRSIPSLLIRSDDVKAGHSARVEKISGDKLFYLTGRWLDQKSATNLLLESMIGGVFGRFRHIHEKLYQDLQIDILNHITAS